MTKRIAIMLLAGAIALSGITYASSSEQGLTIDIDKIDIIKLSEENIYRDGEEPKVQIIVSEQKVQKAESDISKITFMLEQEIKANKKMSTLGINVNVVVHFDYSSEDFEKAFKEIFGDSLTIIKEKHGLYLVENITSEQLSKLEKMDEVLYIASTNNFSLPDEPASWNENEDNEIGINLNAATDMIGVKKARKDFKVTGDLDGRENSYSKNDVVIAVMDTGIDAEHVDLDGGKVIGWYDAVNGELDPYDDHGHGTHVASIAAGTGEGDPGIQEGVAPGAALVGIKTLPEAGKKGNPADTLRGLRWILQNLDTYGINVVNMSIGTSASYEARKEIIEVINEIDAQGVPVFVSAGNDGNKPPYYDTLSTYAKYTSTSVGNIKDPYEGGWGLSESSSRGTDRNVSYNNGPYVVLPGYNIRAAAANTGSEYTVKSGTSMSAPMLSGVYALMYDAAYSLGQSTTIRFSGTDMGEIGYDKNYGNGRILAYDSIKNAAQGSGSFNTYRTYICIPDGYVSYGKVVLYPIGVNSGEADLNVTMIVLDENEENLDIVIWAPGDDPYQGAPSTYWIKENKAIPQEHFSLSNPPTGTYYIGVYGADDSANYSLEITGHQLSIN